MKETEKSREKTEQEALDYKNRHEELREMVIADMRQCKIDTDNYFLELEKKYPDRYPFN